MAPPFMSGLRLARAYYGEMVRPMLDDAFGPLPHGFIDNTDALGRTELLQATIAAVMSEPDE